MPLVAPPLPKKPWTAPELIIIPLFDTLNNSSGGGDSDSASADS